MQRLIKYAGGAVTVLDDGWLRLLAGEARPAEGDILLSLADWLAGRNVVHSGRVGVWLGAGDDPEQIADALDELPVIGIEFGHFSDGRGYSIARLLRDRYGFSGELRALGDIQRDQLFYLHAVGFDAFSVKPEDRPDAIAAGLRDFSATYGRRGWQ
ncbi:DUF934 domain-containing protein [Laribacter hongkongensis]|nr:DUF934 domain-containing protein [Laribacter hongkongensis]MCG9059625.1 DUF934 domain-containing protein [Laribacter hongkongensis]MCG9076497.1 DUF934 domain-containing protein [Laribacter hongkongensis]MCG9086396.1 DUF934 domain-containing protein [Laribacter hongkongensis]